MATAPPPPNPPPSGGGIYGIAATLTRTPLGFLGLCLVLVYAIAGLVFAVSRNLPPDQAGPVVWFIVLYPVLVLVTFAVLIVFFRDNIIFPDNFKTSQEFLDWESRLRRVDARSAANERKVDVIAEVAPQAFDWLPVDDPPDAAGGVPSDAAARAARSDDPQKNRWGGQPAGGGFLVRSRPVRPLKSDPDYYRIPLEVVSTAAGTPDDWTARFHLHDSFTPDVQEVEAEDGVATLELVGYGAFTAGVEVVRGGATVARLEIDLSDRGVDAPAAFKAV